MKFNPNHIEQTILQKNAYNLRWAEVEKEVIPLTAADLDLPCAPQISAAIQKYAADNCFNYGPATGMPELKDAFAHYFFRKKDVVVNPENVLPVNSAAFGIFLTCKSFLEKNDEAIIFDPVDFLFRYSIEQVGAKAVSFAIPIGTDKVDFSAMETLITPRTKLICLCNPLNPTGKVFTKSELFQLAYIAEKYNLIILSDEIWSDIVFSPFEFSSIAALDESINNRTVLVTGLSKSYGLAGLRIGAVICKNSLLFKKIKDNSLHQSTINGVNTLSQVAAITALNDCDEWLNQFLAHLHKMRTICIDEIAAIKGISCVPPQGCYVAFINVSKKGFSSNEMHQILLKKAKVAVVPGLEEWFGAGAEGYIRISFATSESILKEAFTRIRNII